MEIWLDTCDSQAIKAANRFGLIYGITTNPSLLAGAHEDHERVISALLEEQDGPLAVQVTAEEADEMIKRGESLHAYSNRIIVKIPVTEEGLVAINALSKQEIPVMATAIFHPKQAWLAALAGAQYAAPYLGRMFDSGIDAYTSLQSIVKIYQTYGIQTKILAAALKTTDQVIACAEMGIDAVTLKHALFSQLVADDPLTSDSLRAFAEDWEGREHVTESALVL